MEYFWENLGTKNSLDVEKGCINRSEALARPQRTKEQTADYHWKNDTLFTLKSMIRLSQASADVLVCHEAPSYTDKGFRGIDLLAERLGAKLIVHGHLHNDEIALSENSQTAVRSLAEAQVWSIQDDLKLLTSEAD